MVTAFGRLESKALRDAWPDEAKDFTPWLADNLERLSEAIDIPLESEGTEVSVEQFAADILARNTDDGSAVLIENQLESSDHKHLGQILTYLAGLEAQTVIWIARHFEEAHRSAIRWLNENTADPFAFFAVQVKVVQIGDSPLAPLFEVLEKPSKWDRQLRAVSRKSHEDSTESRRAFWMHYAERHPDDGISPDAVKWGTTFGHDVESADLAIRQYVETSGNRIGIYLRGKWGEPQVEAFDRIKRYEAALQKEGIELGDEEWPAIKSLLINMADKANWDNAADWLHEYLHIYRRILAQSP